MLEEKDPARSAPSSVHEVEGGEEKVLRCNACDAPIARERDRVERCGGHTHDRVNPAGFAFRIACFARADGARPVGEESDEFPWFPRHRWQVVVCGSCLVHLGWRFDNGMVAGFYGLDLARLR